MSTALDQEFETGVRLIRDAYTKKVSLLSIFFMMIITDSSHNGKLKLSNFEEIWLARMPKSKVGSLEHQDLVDRYESLVELLSKVGQLEVQLSRNDRQLQEVQKSASKLYHFKQNILQSFAGEEQALQATFFHPDSTFDTVIPQRNGRQQLYEQGSPLLNKPSSYPHPLDDYEVTSPIRQPPKQPAQTPVVTGASGPVYSSLGNLNEMMAQQELTNSRATLNTVRAHDPSSGRESMQGHASASAAPSEKHLSREATVDGREFFRRAKSILSYDDFTNLLWNVKAYNSREQNRAQTLEKVFNIFGEKYPKVYSELVQLLSAGSSHR